MSERLGHSKREMPAIIKKQWGTALDEGDQGGVTNEGKAWLWTRPFCYNGHYLKSCWPWMGSEERYNNILMPVT